MECATIVPKSWACLKGERDVSYYIRRMCQEDVAQVTEIDHEAFPTMWPPANYERELKVSLAHYIAACEEGRSAGRTEITEAQKRIPLSLSVRMKRLSNHADSPGRKGLPPGEGQYIIGFAGLWMMADEAHITNIAVRQGYQRRGIGEHLLIVMISLAVEQNARTLTLEVRASNTAAQKLYHKYGFTQVNIHRSYYTDNREDALVLAVEDITGAAFQRRLHQLEKAHSRKWGVALYHIVR